MLASGSVPRPQCPSKGVQRSVSSSLPPPPEAPGRSVPFWKSWWFWAFVVVIILIAVGVGSVLSEGGDEAASTPTAVTTPTAPTATAPTGRTFTPPPPPVVVPDVVGMSLAEAGNALQDQTLKVFVEEKYSNEAKGTVLKQTPRSSLEVPEGTTVELIVAQPLPKIPKVVGKTLANAKRALKNAGFEVGKVTQQTSRKKKGTVISQSPDASTSARPGRTVSLVTAKPARS